MVEQNTVKDVKDAGIGIGALPIEKKENHTFRIEVSGIVNTIGDF